MEDHVGGMADFPHACFHLVRDKEFSSHFGLAFSLVCSSLSSGSIQRIFLKSPTKGSSGLRGHYQTKLSNVTYGTSPSVSASQPRPRFTACFCLRHRLGSPDIILASLDTISLLEESSVRPHNTGFPWVTESRGVLHCGGLTGRRSFQLWILWLLPWLFC